MVSSEVRTFLLPFLTVNQHELQGCHFQPIADENHRLISEFALVTFLKLQVEN